MPNYRLREDSSNISSSLESRDLGAQWEGRGVTEDATRHLAADSSLQALESWGCVLLRGLLTADVRGSQLIS